MAQNTGRMTAGQRVDDVKASIPGTHAYEARHGYDKAHANMQNLKAHLPGTAEHNNRATGLVGHNTMPTTGAGMPNTGTAGMANTGTAGMTTGEKIMSAVPGTVENREKKMAQGNMMGTGAYDQQGLPMGGATGHTHVHTHGHHTGL